MLGVDPDEMICLMCGNYLSEDEWTATLRLALKLGVATDVPITHPDCWVLEGNEQ